jgi:hypothetical protein
MRYLAPGVAEAQSQRETMELPREITNGNSIHHTRGQWTRLAIVDHIWAAVVARAAIRMECIGNNVDEDMAEALEQESDRSHLHEPRQASRVGGDY